MKIAKGIRIVDLALYLEEHNSLVLGDVHLGFEEALGKQGILMPRFQYKDTVERLGRIFEKIGKRKLSQVIINGDLKHEFGEISSQEWREILKFIDFILEHSEKIVLVKGNHDIILYPIARKREINVLEYYSLGNIYISHGHVIPKDEDFRKAKTLIIGNEHPAVTIKGGVRAELFKCFLKGEWNGKQLIVMPSFNLVTIGSDLLREQFLSPFLGKGILGFEVFVVGDKIYWFGKLKDLKK